MLTEQETTTRLFIAENHARELRAENANLRSLLRNIYDVATEQRIHHLCRGGCPEPATGNHHWRDDECPACQVLTQVSAELSCEQGKRP